MLGHKQLTRFQNDRIWNAVTIYLTQLAKVYRYCLAQYEVGARGARSFGRMLPTIAARTMRACAARMKWYDLRYIPIEVEQWQELAAVYLLAESGGFARESLSLYRKAAQDSSVEQEFLRAIDARDRLAGIDAAGADRGRRTPGGALRAALPHRHPAYGVDALLHRPALGCRSAPDAVVRPHPGHRARLRRGQRDRRDAPDPGTPRCRAG